MNYFVTAWQWWLQSLLSTSCVLVIAYLAVAMIRQPVRRKRILELALLGCVAAVLLATLSGMPRWSLAQWFGEPTTSRDLIALRRQAAEATRTQANIDEVPAAQAEAIQSLADTPENAELLASWRQLQDEIRRSGDPAAAAAAESPTMLLGASILGIVSLILYALIIVVMNLYALGALAMALWWLCGLATVWHVVRRSRPAAPSMQDLLAQVIADSPWPTRPSAVRLLVSDRVMQPFTFTWHKPTIVFPASLVNGDVQSLRWSLAHEWAHVAASDARWWSLSGLLRIVLFYQPLIYWLRRELRRSQDFLADATAIGEDEAADYAEFLTRCVSRMATPVVPASVLGIGGRRSELHRRVTMLVAPRRPLEQRCPRRWSIFVAILAACLSALAITCSAVEQPGQAIEPADRVETAAPAAAEGATDEPLSATLAEQQSVRADLTWIYKQQAVESASQQGLAYLRANQQADGSWTDVPGNEGGVTALATLAMIAAGVPADDPQLQMALVRVRGIEPKSTYLVSLQTQALCASQPQVDMNLIRRNVEWLEKSQCRVGAVGGWSYQGGTARADGSNTLFALLALDAARRADVRVQPQTWQAAVDYWTTSQAGSGGWPYINGGPVTATMTAAGVASLSIAERQCAHDDESDATHAERVAAVARGAAWLQDNWRIANPTGVHSWQFYYLHTLAAAARQSGHAQVGTQTWKQDCSNWLISRQKADGSWTGAASEQNPALATSFAVIFLSAEKVAAGKQMPTASKAANAATITPLDVLRIDASGTHKGQDIHGDYIVEPSGEIALGPAYGRVDVLGLTYREAETAILKQLKKTLREPHVAVTLGGWKNKPPKEVQQSQRRISPLDVVRIEVVGTFIGQDIFGEYIVEPGGEVALGPEYGRVNLNDATYREAEEAIARQLKTVLRSPEVSVTLGGWKKSQSDDERIRKLETEIHTLKSTIEVLKPKQVDGLDADAKKLPDAIKSPESQH